MGFKKASGYGKFISIERIVEKVKENRCLVKETIYRNYENCPIIDVRYYYGGKIVAYTVNIDNRNENETRTIYITLNADNSIIETIRNEFRGANYSYSYF